MTVQKNLLEGALLVVVVLFLLLGNVRAALLTAAVIPLAMLMTITGMVESGVSANLMSLGALDFGLIVDGAVIIVENCLRRLGEAQPGRAARPRGAPRARHERDARGHPAGAVRRLHHHGRLHPDLCADRRRRKDVPSDGDHGGHRAASAPWSCRSRSCRQPSRCLFRGPRRNSARRSSSAARRSCIGRCSRARCVSASRWSWWRRPPSWRVAGSRRTRLGTEFMPNLDEGDIAMHALRIPGTSLQQAIELQQQLEGSIRAMPEVERVFAKIGTAEVATDPMPPSVADNFIILKPRSEWPDPRKPKSQFVAELEALVTPIPGNRYEFLQPIQMRFNELIAGVRAELAVKVFGDDLDTLIALGRADRGGRRRDSGRRRRRARAGDGPAGADDRAEARGARALRRLDRASAGRRRERAWAARWPADFTKATAGPTSSCACPRSCAPIRTRSRRCRSRLPKAATFRCARSPSCNLGTGYNQILRENGKRRVVVTSNVRGRDLGSFVNDVRDAVARRRRDTGRLLGRVRRHVPAARVGGESPRGRRAADAAVRSVAARHRARLVPRRRSSSSPACRWR